MKRVCRSILFLGIVALGGTLSPRHAAAQRMSSSSMHADSTAKRPSQSYSIEIKDFSFGPMMLTVPAGATVTWTNKDEEPHTVFSSDDVFKSKALDTDEKFSFTFTKPGTYKYFCSVHPKMVGAIVVADSSKKQPMEMGKAN